MKVNQSGRGVSSLIGIVLLFAIVTAGMGSVVVLGSTALTDTQDQVDDDLAVKMFQAADGQVSELRKSSTEASGSVDIPNELSGDVVVDPDAANLTVSTIHNGTSTDCGSPIDIGTMRYERNGEAVAIYQGGMVFKQAESGVSIHSAPDVQYRSGSLQFWLLQFSDEHTASDKIVLDNSLDETRNQTLTLRQEINSCIQNVTDAGGNPSIGIEIQSEYAQGWYQYFDRKYPGHNASYDASSETAKTVFTPPNGTNSSSTSSLNNPEICGSGDDYEDEWEYENETLSYYNTISDDDGVSAEDAEEKEELEVECDSGDLDIDWDNVTKDDTEFTDGSEVDFDRKYEEEYEFTDSNLTRYEWEDEYDLKTKNMTNDTRRKNYLSMWGATKVEDLQSYYHELDRRYDAMDSGFEYEPRENRTTWTYLNDSEEQLRPDEDDVDGVSSPIDEGPEEILNDHLSRFDGQQCLSNGWCEEVTSPVSESDSISVSVRILEVSTAE